LDAKEPGVSLTAIRLVIAPHKFKFDLLTHRVGVAASPPSPCSSLAPSHGVEIIDSGTQLENSNAALVQVDRVIQHTEFGYM
jgi:hypothetical protein